MGWMVVVIKKCCHPHYATAVYGPTGLNGRVR